MKKIKCGKIIAFGFKALGKITFAMIAVLFLSCANTGKTSERKELSMDITELIEKELRGSFDFFWNETPVSETGYGLTRDNTNPSQRDFCSIASVGFALASYTVGVEKGWISFDEGKERCIGTLKTFERLPHYQGFFHHFITISTEKPWPRVEVSTIDTALFLAGALVSAEYFGGEAMEIFDRLYRRVNWQILLKENRRFHMAFRDVDGNFEPFGEWTEAAEQFIMYIFAGGSPTYPVGGDVFYVFQRWVLRQGEHEYIRSYMNGIFVYQFSHAFIDFRGTMDRRGVDWYENSVNAARYAHQYAINASGEFKTLDHNAWGVSACLGPGGYSGSFGARPNGIPGGRSVDQNDGTLAIYGAVASMPFTPEESKAALQNYAGYEELWGNYGLYDSLNLDRNWFSSQYIGIDKGIEILMLTNYQNGLIWEMFMRNAYVKAGLEEMGITKK